MEGIKTQEIDPVENAIQEILREYQMVETNREVLTTWGGAVMFFGSKHITNLQIIIFTVSFFLTDKYCLR